MPYLCNLSLLSYFHLFGLSVKKKIVVDAVGSAGVVGNVVAGCAAGLVEGVVVTEQAVEDSMALLCIVDSKSSTTLLEFESLAELLVTWAKDDRNAIDGGLRHVVNARAKTTANVGDFAIAIERGEDAEAVDYQAVERCWVDALELCVARHWACDACNHRVETVLVELMWSDDEFEVGM